MQRHNSRRTFLRTAAILTTAVVVGACSAPLEGSNPDPTLTADLPGPQAASSEPQAVEPTAAPAETSHAAPAPDLYTLVAHRLAFGPNRDLRAQFLGLREEEDARLGAFIAQQLEPDSLDDGPFEERLAAAQFETLGKSLETLAQDHIVNNPYDDNDERHWQWFVLPVEELVEAAFLRAVYSRRQVQELLADFWHNHFNVYGWQEDVTPLFVSYDRDVIRANLFGNFRQLLEDVTRHPSMLYYLNNRTNSDAGPNENFARELFELYTLGAENYLGVRDPNEVSRAENGVADGYVDNDVYEAARCFTGWRVDDDLWEGEEEIGKTLAFRYYRPWHDRFNKFILGTYIPADQEDMKDGRDVLDLLAAHPGTARFIAHKLCRRFIADTPPETVVDAAARAFREHTAEPDQLRYVYRAIFLSAEFRQSRGEKIKRPFELAAAAMRALDVQFDRLSGGARWTFERMGQPVFGRRPPDGYPDRASAWANTMATLYGWNLITGLAQNWWSESEDGKNLWVDQAALALEGAPRATEIIDRWIERLALPEFPPGSRAAVIEFLAGDSGPDEPLPAEWLAWRLPAAVELMLMSPDFRLR